MAKYISNDDLVGMKFSLLIINSVDDSGGHRKAFCSCQCGKRTQARVSDLIRKHTQSCGCLPKQNKGPAKGKPKVKLQAGVLWNRNRRKFEVFDGDHTVGFFFEESIANLALTNHLAKNQENYHER